MPKAMQQRSQQCTDTSPASQCKLLNFELDCLDDVQKGEEFAESSSGDEYPQTQGEGFTSCCNVT